MAVIPQSYLVGSAGYGNQVQSGPRWLGQYRTGSASARRPSGSARSLVGDYDPAKEFKRLMEARMAQGPPQLAPKFNRQADLGLSAARLSGENAVNSYLATGRGGDLGRAFAGSVAAQNLIPAQAEAAGIRTQGALAQADAERQWEQENWDRWNQLAALVQRIKEMSEQREMMMAQRAGGGVSGVRIGSSAQAGGQMSPPDPWHLLLDAWGNLNAKGRAMQQAGTLPQTPPGGLR